MREIRTDEPPLRRQIGFCHDSILIETTDRIFFSPLISYIEPLSRPSQHTGTTIASLSICHCLASKMSSSKEDRRNYRLSLNAADQRLYTRIDRILYEDWDPIHVKRWDGPGDCTDEYSAYVPAVFRLLNDGANEQKISEHLQKIASEWMGIETQAQDHALVAQKIVALMPSAESSRDNRKCTDGGDGGTSIVLGADEETSEPEKYEFTMTVDEIETQLIKDMLSHDESTVIGALGKLNKLVHSYNEKKPEMRAAFHEAGGASILYAAMKKNSKNAEIQAMAIRVTIPLSGGVEAFRMALKPTRLLKAIVEAMEAHPKFANLQANSCTVLMNATNTSKVNANFLVKKLEAHEPIVQAMQTFPDEIALQLAGSEALGNFLQFGENTKRLIEEAGGFHALCAAAINHRSNEKIQHAARKALGWEKIQQAARDALGW